MIYYRSSRNPYDLPVPVARLLTLASLLAYPAGAFLLKLGPDTFATSVVGYALTLVSLFCCAPLVSSSLQRVVGDDVKVLDEFELRLRGRAMGVAYAVFTGLTLAFVLYLAIAGDKGFWLPKSYNEFNGLFWGVFLYSIILPVAALSWMVERSFNDDAT